MKKGPVFSDSQCITSIAAVMKHCQNFKHGFQSSGALSCRQARPFRAFRRGILVAAPYDAPMKWALIIKQLTDKDDGWCDAIYRAPLGCLVQPTAVPVTDNTNGQYRIWFRSTTTLFCQGCQRVTVSRFNDDWHWCVIMMLMVMTASQGFSLIHSRIFVRHVNVVKIDYAPRPELLLSQIYFCLRLNKVA